MVEEHFPNIEVYDASRDGVRRRENVGMSNRNSDEISGHRKPKVSLAMVISQGLGGPNLDGERRRGMDSRLIFRPLPHFFDKVTEFSNLSALLDSHGVLSTDRTIRANKLPRKALES